MLVFELANGECHPHAVERCLRNLVTSINTKSSEEAGVEELVLSDSTSVALLVAHTVRPKLDEIFCQ